MIRFARQLFTFRATLHRTSSSIRQLSSETSNEPLKRTTLYDFHVKKGGKMVPFAGYEMPVLYTGDLSIRDSHLHTRSKASIFDVSHMLQFEVRGKDRIKFFESVVVADVEGLVPNTGSLTLYTTETGGIIDDLIVNKKHDTLYVVSNAARATEDMNHLTEQRERFIRQNPNADVTFSIMTESSLLALQGPASEAELQKRVKCDLKTIKFMFGVDTTFDDVPIHITRCGYTGEDGFELCIPNQSVVEVTEKLLDSGVVKLAGLGARDSLRLEAGLCLYGNDIDETTTPIEAGLAWTIHKRRRTTADFPGASIILQQLKDKPKRRRIGLITVSAGPPVRAQSKIYSDQSKEETSMQGIATSGCPAPSVGRNIAIAYVNSGSAKVGTKLFADVRGKLYEYEVTKMPFVETHYYM